MDPIHTIHSHVKWLEQRVEWLESEIASLEESEDIAAEKAALIVYRNELDFWKFQLKRFAGGETDAT